jgi:hypothetical protein
MSAAVCRPSPVAVLAVVPKEEVLAVRPGGFDRIEAAGKADRYFIVLIAPLSRDCWHVRLAVWLGGPEIRERQRDRLGGHRRTPAGVDGQLPAADALLSADGGDKLHGKDRGLAG